MFYNFFALNTIESFDKLDTAQITDMSHMFDSCTSLPTLDLSNNFITSNVTDMSYMFEDCTSLVTIIVSEDFDVTNVTNSTDMFNNCTSIVGDNDTTYDNAHVDKMYARIDGGPDSTTPGYFIYTPKVYLLKYMKNLPTDYELLDEDDWYDPSSSVNPSSNPIRVSGTAEGMICKSTSTSEIRVLEMWNTEADGSGTNYNFPIVVEPNENPISIQLVHTADMDIYANGETFLPIGIIIKANYNGGISRNVEYVGETKTRFEFNPELTTPLTTTDTSVDLTYRSISGISIPITVTAAITSISLINPLDMTEYSYGDKFNPAGIKILVNYDDSTSNEVAYNGYKNYFIFNPSPDTPFAESTIGTSQNVTITYKVHDTNFTTDPILGNMIYFYYYDNATNKNVHRHDTVDTYVNQAASSGATGFFFFNADGYNDGLSKYNRNTVGTMTKAQALDYINNYDPTIEGRKFMRASYYKPSPGPSPRPGPSGGGSSGGGGGSGVGPMTNIINSKTILKNKTYKLPLDASVVRWEYKPMEKCSKSMKTK